jgi:hypothetical protein
LEEVLFDFLSARQHRKSKIINHKS